MKIFELRKLNEKELEKRLSKLQTELNESKFDIITGQEKDYAILPKKRKEIARIKTLLNEGFEIKETKTNKVIKQEKNDEKESE